MVIHRKDGKFESSTSLRVFWGHYKAQFWNIFYNCSKYEPKIHARKANLVVSFLRMEAVKWHTYQALSYIMTSNYVKQLQKRFAQTIFQV